MPQQAKKKQDSKKRRHSEEFVSGTESASPSPKKKMKTNPKVDKFEAEINGILNKGALLGKKQEMMDGGNAKNDIEEELEEKNAQLRLQNHSLILELEIAQNEIRNKEQTGVSSSVSLPSELASDLTNRFTNLQQEIDSTIEQGFWKQQEKMRKLESSVKQHNQDTSTQTKILGAKLDDVAQMIVDKELSPILLPPLIPMPPSVIPPVITTVQQPYESYRPYGSQQCTNCCKRGHTVSTCFDIRGYPPTKPYKKIA